MSTHNSKKKESKEILREKTINFLSGMLQKQDADQSNYDYKQGELLRPIDDDKLAKKTEKHEILVIGAKPYTIEAVLNEIVNNGDYSDVFVEMINTQRVKMDNKKV